MVKKAFWNKITYIKEICLLKANKTCSNGPNTKEYDGIAAPSRALEAHTICNKIYTLAHFLLHVTDLEPIFDIASYEGIFKMNIINLYNVSVRAKRLANKL